MGIKQWITKLGTVFTDTSENGADIITEQSDDGGTVLHFLRGRDKNEYVEAIVDVDGDEIISRRMED